MMQSSKLSNSMLIVGKIICHMMSEKKGETRFCLCESDPGACPEKGNEAGEGPRAQVL